MALSRSGGDCLDGQSQYSPFIGVGKGEDPILSKVHQYVSEHLTETLSIEAIANAASVSRRTLARVFAKYAKVTPTVFVVQGSGECLVRTR